MYLNPDIQVYIVLIKPISFLIYSLHISYSPRYTLKCFKYRSYTKSRIITYDELWPFYFLFPSIRHVDINGYIFTYNKDSLVLIQVN